MKKKAYTAPTTEQYIFSPARLCTGSITTDGDGNATVTPSEEEYEGDDWGSRRLDGKRVWDDEEELDNEEERW